MYINRLFRITLFDSRWHIQKSFFIGLLAVFLVYLPLLLLGGDSATLILDQLDESVMTYTLRADHLFQSFIPEFMGGMPVSALPLPSTATVLFYFIFPSEYAFVIHAVCIALISYFGMYLCQCVLTSRPGISAVISFVFCLLPFYSVFGLSVMGQPWLVYAIWRLCKGRSVWLSYIIVVVFALFSSLASIGYADCLLIFLFAVFLLVRKHFARWHVLIAFGLLVGTYLICYADLLAGAFFGGEGLFTVSHRAEMVPAARSWIGSFIDMMWSGQHHAHSRHAAILLLTVPTTAYAILRHKKKLDKKKRLFLLILLEAVVIVIALLYAAWSSDFVINARTALGGVFVSFQADRFYWLYPTLWFFILGLEFYYADLFVQDLARKVGKKKGKEATKYVRRMAFGMLGVFIIAQSFYATNPGAVIQNWKQLVGNPASQTQTSTLNKFYSPDLFVEIQDYIADDPSTYRVASVGMHPAISLYNGFSTIDGYTNNYPLEYKHRFRKIIAAELEKSRQLKVYFDNWGHRCYVFSSQIPNQFIFFKDSEIVLDSIELDTNAMYEMGCRYVLSALPIDSPYTPGLDFVKSFTNAMSDYEIYLYQVDSSV